MPSTLIAGTDGPGILWQGRFFSSPLDDDYPWFCVRYVERNPDRAGMVETAEGYPWSSAAAYCGSRRDDLLSTAFVHPKVFAEIENW
jgi:putative transposase